MESPYICEYCTVHTVDWFVCVESWNFLLKSCCLSKLKHKGKNSKNGERRGGGVSDEKTHRIYPINQNVDVRDMRSKKMSRDKKLNIFIFRKWNMRLHPLTLEALVAFFRSRTYPWLPVPSTPEDPEPSPQEAPDSSTAEVLSPLDPSTRAEDQSALCIRWGYVLHSEFNTYRVTDLRVYVDWRW